MVFSGLISIFIIIVYFKTASSVKLDCQIPENPDYRQRFETSRIYTRESLKCSFSADDKDALHIDSNLKINNSLITLFYSSTSVPILTAELYEKLPTIRFCVFNNISKIFTIDREWFQHSGNLKELFFLDNRIPKLDGGKLVDLKGLVVLCLRRNFIEQFDENALAGLKVLEWLDLGENQIESMNPRLFEELTSLIYLNLAGNPLKSLDVNIFRDLTNLNFLHLGKTLLQTVPDGIFDTNTNLEHIYMQANISRISNKIFNKLKKLSFLNVKDNFCVSAVFQEQNLSQKFTEDILYPCSCDLKNHEKASHNLIFFSIVFGVIGILVLFIFKFAGKFLTTNTRNQFLSSQEFSFRDIFEQTMKEYIQNTSIHGLNYVCSASYLIIR